MKIHVINPNSTRSMTEIAGRAARRVAAPGTEILLGHGEGAPASIEGHADAALALPGLLAAIRAADEAGAAAHVIACFDDPGLHAAREVARAPVLGICQAAVQVASTLAARFSIVTTLPRSVTIIEDLVAHYGAGHACRRVRSVEMAVLDLEVDPDATFEKLRREILAARDEDGAEAVVLGCAGMAELCESLTEATGLPVIDGVVAAVKLAEAYAGLGIGTSKTGSYADPLPKAGGFATHTCSRRVANTA